MHAYCEDLGLCAHSVSLGSVTAEMPHVCLESSAALCNQVLLTCTVWTEISDQAANKMVDDSAAHKSLANTTFICVMLK